LSDAAPNRSPPRFQLLSAEDEIPDPATPDDPPAELLQRAQEAQRAMRELSPAYKPGDRRDMDRLIENTRGAEPAAVTIAKPDVSASSPAVIAAPVRAAALAPCPVHWGLGWDNSATIAENSRNCTAIVNGHPLKLGAAAFLPLNGDTNGHVLQVPKGTGVIVMERWRPSGGIRDVIATSAADTRWAFYDRYTVKLPDGTVGTVYRLSLKPSEKKG
jgi:hypothetical protein